MTPHVAAVLTPAQQLERVALDVAQQAAELVRASMGDGAAAGTKSSPTDVVTHTDLESERLIRAELLIRTPGSTIVGEELDDEVGSSRVGWIVDPIDGTVNFLYDLPVVSVSVAATIDDVVVAGAVIDVVRGESFSAVRGMGARRSDVPIAASTTQALAGSLIGTGFAYDAQLRSAQAETLARLLPVCRDVRCMGSAALNLCWVACGRLDAYFEQDIKIYDYAAGALIAEEAGATVALSAGPQQDFTVSAAAGIFDNLMTIIVDS